MGKRLLFIFIITLQILTGCEKSGIITNFSGNYPYYIEGYLETGRYAMVHISQTTSISQPVNYTTMDADSAIQFYGQLNAHVLLLKDGIVVDSLTGPFSNGYGFLANDKVLSGYWYLQGHVHIIEAGGSYQVRVKVNSQPDMVANCVVPERVDIQKLDTININNEFVNFYPPGDSIPQYQGGTWYWVPMCYYILTFNDPPTQQNYYRLEGSLLNKKNTYIDGPINEWYIQHFSENPVFENKYIDYFPVYPPFFKDQLFNGNQQMLKLDAGVSDSLLCINLVSISEGYYNRLKSVDAYGANVNHSFAAPVEIFSNFTNAKGFLAGRTVSSDTIRFTYTIGTDYP